MDNIDEILAKARKFKDNNEIDKMIEEYYILINANIPHAMVELGNYYYGINDHENMKKYYLMAIEKGDCYHAMYLMAEHYKKIKDYENMKKYYIMFIEKENDLM